MEFVATYNTGGQIGSIYNMDLDHEIVFALVDGDNWEPIASVRNGQVKDIPSCFRPDPALLDALNIARRQGHSHDME